MRIVRAVDLFCGAGGTSSGLTAACRDLGAKLDLLAINHWPVAIATHERNMPGVRHLCAAVEAVSPSDAVPSRKLDLLVASPECKHFSTARGGRPINDQKRADPWQVIRWCAELRVDNVLIENVPEFRSWGPLGANGRPLRSRRGETYRTYLDALRGLGYAVEDRILNAADYGDPTTRRRLFVLARLRKPVRWPEPTHGRPGELLPGLKPWRAAREIIDWSIAGESIFGRKRPLSRNTIERIIAGLQRFGGPELGPFLVVLRGTDPYHIQRSGRPIELPLDAVCATANHFGLVEPSGGAFLLGQQSGGSPRDIGEPVPTVATDGAIAMVRPLIVKTSHRGGNGIYARPVDEPLYTVTTAGGEQALVTPFLVPRYGERDGQTPRTHSVDAPMPTVPTSCQHHLAQAFIVSAGGPKVSARSVDQPMNTVLTRDHMGLVEPFLVQVNHGDNPKGSGRGNGGRVRSIEQPAPTVTATQRGLALVEALIAKYYGTGLAKPVTEPIDTVTTKPRFGLVTFEKDRGGVALDIRFRMLKPRELARAQGFSDEYEFTGNVEDQVCQIGNAVPHHLARALTTVLLR